jgi:hypothetical protein
MHFSTSHKKEITNLYWKAKARMLRWARYVAGLGNIEIIIEFICGNVLEYDHI